MKIRNAGYSLVIIFLLTVSSNTYAMKASWDEVPNASGYNVYISSTHDLAAQKTGDIATLTTFSTYICHDVDPSVKVYFVAVTAFDGVGNESAVSNIPYILKGNIVGRYEDGTSYTNARVDGADLVALGANWGQNTTHTVYDCSYFYIEDQSVITQRQWADINKDGRVDGLDYFILAVNYGNTAN